MTYSHPKYREEKPSDGLHAVFASLLAQSGLDEPGVFYAKARECVGGTKAEPKDVMAFSNGLRHYRSKTSAGWKAGMFISALVNNSEHQHFVVSAGSAGQTLDYLGFRNEKNLVIIGHAGNRLGWEMTRGSIFVDGNAGNETGGRMADGKIWVQGDAGEKAGTGMRGGLLHIRGKPGKEAGHTRQGGTILFGAEEKSYPLPASAVMDTVEEMTSSLHPANTERGAHVSGDTMPCPAAGARLCGESFYMEANVKALKER